MKMVKLCTALMLMSFAVGTLYSGGKQETGAESRADKEVQDLQDAETLTVTDYLGREVTIPLPIERAVVFDDVMSVIVYSSGSGGKSRRDRRYYYR